MGRRHTRPARSGIGTPQVTWRAAQHAQHSARRAAALAAVDGAAGQRAPGVHRRGQGRCGLVAPAKGGPPTENSPAGRSKFETPAGGRAGQHSTGWEAMEVAAPAYLQRTAVPEQRGLPAARAESHSRCQPLRLAMVWVMLRPEAPPAACAAVPMPAAAAATS